MHQILNDDSEDYAYIDGRYEIENSGWLSSIDFGIKTTAHEARAGLQRNDLWRISRADQHDADQRLRRSVHSGGFPERGRGTGHH